MKENTNLPVVLIVDDDQSVLETFKVILDGRFAIQTADSGRKALDIIANRLIDIVFLDIRMPDMDGIQILRKIKEYDRAPEVIIATAVDSAKTAVKAMHLGAFNYIIKPFDSDEVLALAEKALEKIILLKEITCFRKQQEEVRFGNIIGKSKKMQDIYKIIEKVVKNDSTVLISGESGTGKELIARAIHLNSVRFNKPFIPINCASIPGDLLESELFGYEKGAFTNATQHKLGMFELAHEGVLFLDEISSLRWDMQAKILRALEEREIKKVGGTQIIKIDVRIISATNSDLKKAVENKQFRQDLYYRLNVVPICLPPLRERKEDIPLLANHFLRSFNLAFKKNITGFTEESLECLNDYDWPGNVRELKNVIECLAALKDDDGVITPKDLPFEIFIKYKLVANSQFEGGLKRACGEFEKRYIESVLERENWNQNKTAEILGIHRNSLASKIKNLGVKKSKTEK